MTTVFDALIRALRDLLNQRALWGGWPILLAMLLWLIAVGVIIPFVAAAYLKESLNKSTFVIPAKAGIQ
jgi:hypothetical protein